MFGKCLENLYLCIELLINTNMASVTAFIKPAKGKPDTKVRFYVSRGREMPLLYYTSEIVVDPEFFDKKNQIIKKRVVYNETARAEFNKSVSDFKAIILKAYTDYPGDKETITSKQLEDEISKALHPEKHIEVKAAAEKPQTVLKYIRYFVENAGSRKDKRTKRLLSPSTKKQYITTQRHLIQFAKSKHKTDFLFSEINEKFYSDFVDYLTRKEYIIKHRRGEEVNEIRRYTLNSVGKYVRALKVMIADAGTTEADTSKFYVFNEEVDNIYLNETELEQLKNADFSKTPSLDRARDWFLLLAWTGCRFSDLEKISKTDIKDNFITFRQQKTNTKVTIPLHPVVNEILQKYNFEMPEPITNQKFNDYIKEVAKIAGLNSSEVLTRTEGGTLKTATMPKYELISSHTGRRSFCTNMYKLGLPTLMIMSISGHKTEKSFLKYIKVRQEEHAEMLAAKWKEIYK